VLSTPFRRKNADYSRSFTSSKATSTRTSCCACVGHRVTGRCLDFARCPREPFQRYLIERRRSGCSPPGEEVTTGFTRRSHGFWPGCSIEATPRGVLASREVEQFSRRALLSRR